MALDREGSVHSKHTDVEKDAAIALDISSEEEFVHQGVKTVEATNKIFGKYSKWALFVGLGLAAYVYSLDGQTTYYYLTWAASDFNDHSLISTIQTAQSIIIACGKPAIAKVADVSSRGSAYFVVLVFYVVGYIVIASAHNIQTVAGGIVLYAIGYTGLQLLTQIIIADITTLKWRGLVSSLISLPFIINAFIGSNVYTNVMAHAGWRWGYGMFAILIPVSLSPLIVTLLWAERKAKRLGLVPPKKQDSNTKLVSSAWRIAQEMDLIGLVLIGASVALILLPLTLAGKANGGWSNPSMIAMIVIGCCLLPVFGVWDVKLAKFPVIPYRFLKNRSIAIASAIGFFDFISFYLTFTYLFSFIIVVKPWSSVNSSYFIQTQTVALTIFGIMAGVIMRFTNRYKWLLTIGLAIRLTGVGLMIHSRGANASDAEVVWTQILQGLGGGIASACGQVAAQASVPHVDVAMATAVVLLLTEIGGSIGSAAAGAVWTNNMPEKLAQYLPDVSEEDRAALFGSISTVITQYERGSAVRNGVIQAYSDVMHIMLIIATVVSVIPFLLSLFMPDWYLGDTQNAVDGEGLEGSEMRRTEVDSDTKV
ncbi:hypothetical protein VKT23_014125 [Stygiomarasmius scandens]|uniref:Major facilitator superfamily (MFS) profile domain-containing protein n=1 Tax=Marasmiellus scandens TaxID=2682957 RepID=A0ABR1J611_9AGAR